MADAWLGMAGAKGLRKGCVPYAVGCGLVVGARNCVCEVVQVFGEVRVCRGRDAARAECGKTLLDWVYCG